MAEMIPESISTNQNVTPGEKRVFRVLQEALQPDEDFLVWYEPRIIDRYPDFIVWGQYLGLLVVEVKDWIVDQIIEMNSKVFKVSFNGKTEEILNPLEQARGAANKMMEKLRKIPSFVHEKGSNYGKLKFPVGYCTLFTNITRKQSQEGITQVLPDNCILFSDDLSFDSDSREKQREFFAKLRQTFTVKFEFDPLSYDEIKILRYQLFPEVRVNPVRKLRNEKDEQLIRTLDLEQERTAKGLGEGHRILKGVAGSGKTLVLACRAKYLRKLQPNWRILVVCYNIALSRYIQSLIELSGPEDGGGATVEVIHFHGLVKELTHSDLSIWEGEEYNHYDVRVGDILKGEIAKGVVKRGMYDAILIDEGQDFTTEWIQGLTQLLNEKNDSLLFCYDPAQKVFQRKRPNWKSAGLKVQGKRPTELNKSYRNTVEILEVAKRFAKIVQATPINDDENPYQPLFPISTDRHGPKVFLQKCSNTEELFSYILEKIESYLTNDDCNLSDIGVLYPDSHFKDFPNRFSEIFKKRFDIAKLCWIKTRKDKINFDLSSESIKLITIQSCKGLEFKVVFLIGVESMPRFVNDEEYERRLAYVGLTRAQDILHIPYEADLGYIPELENIVSEIS